MKIVILGSGRVGARLAQLMEAEGHDVNIIDGDKASFDRLPDSFKGRAILGTGIDVDVLKSAGIESADAFAAVTNFDNTNIMACQVAKEIFGVKKVLARIYDPGREQLYHELGLETICPTTLISTTSRDILLAADGVEILQMPPHTGGPKLNVTPITSSATTPLSNDEHEGHRPMAQSARTQADSDNRPGQQASQVPQPNGGDNQGERSPNNGRGLRGIFKH
ncbi:MAG TPA: TrkA family potassium uptake protein [Chloroflexia bacterium]|nr:TrkA family potassium uptake protein [Chloroflexia bacterium]